MDDDEIDLAGMTGIRKYSYLPYSYWRIREILKDHYNAYLEEIIWYKCSRVPNYHQAYKIKNISTGNIIAENVVLDDLRRVFAKQDFPLKKTDVIQKRNAGAEYFLETVKHIQGKG